MQYFSFLVCPPFLLPSLSSFLTLPFSFINLSITHLPPLSDKLPELAQLVMENERLRRKHRKVQHRRDHYARLYYRCQADLDEKKWELHFARIKISELKEQCMPCTKHST